MVTEDPILEVGRKYFGLNYLFPYQRLAIHNILLASGYFPEEEDPAEGDQIILLPTGAGKSLCFQLPALLLTGLTLVVYPLLSLMADQRRRLEAAGVPTQVLQGNQSPEERKALFHSLQGGQVKILLTNPETLLVPSTLNRLKQFPLTHFVVDEAHCICQWGESFRPSYLKLEKVRSILKPTVTTAFTATASPEVLEKITHYLFPDRTPHLISSNPDRPNLYYSVEETLSKKRTLRRLLSSGKGTLARPVVIFCRSRKETELLCLYLRTTLEEEDIFFYHAGLSPAEKKQIENWFFQSSQGILTATTAYGMGVDKANIRTVIHMEAPSTVEAYLQESGRAGRDSKPSRVLLLVSPQDRYNISPFFQEYGKTLTCLRQFLYRKLGAELDSCSGCDNCDRRESFLEGSKEIIALIKKNPRRFTRKELIGILKGKSNLYSKSFFTRKWHGALTHWEEEELEEALENLIEKGFIRIGKRIWKNRVSLCKGVTEQSSSLRE